MKVRQIPVSRVSYISARPFDEVLDGISNGIGHPNLAEFIRACNAAKDDAELRAIVARAVSPIELMEFLRLDTGKVLEKEMESKKAPRSIRLIVGNPVIMRSMAKHVPDAASYAPVTLLIDERLDGVHISYDLMASLLAPYENEEAIAIGKDLDRKIEDLVQSAIR